MTKIRTITVPAGIGDSIWILMKLLSQDEKFHFVLPGGQPRRGGQVFELLPQVAESYEYRDGLSYARIAKDNAQQYINEWERLKKKPSFVLSANKHLEDGNRIEDFLPDLPVMYRISWNTGRYASRTKEILSVASAPLIGLYGSSYTTSRAWGFWTPEDWLKLAKMILLHDSNYVFVIIGAEWDTDHAAKLMALLKTEKIPYVNTIGEPLGVVIEIMKRLHYFFSFPSGLGIMAPTVHCPVCMFYPDGKVNPITGIARPNLEPMINAWADPDDIWNGLYKGALFCEPEEIFSWVVENQMI